MPPPLERLRPHSKELRRYAVDTEPLLPTHLAASVHLQERFLERALHHQLLDNHRAGCAHSPSARNDLGLNRLKGRENVIRQKAAAPTLWRGHTQQAASNTLSRRSFPSARIEPRQTVHPERKCG